MFYFILLVLTIFPFIFLNLINNTTKTHLRINQIILYIWFITYLFFTFLSSVYFSNLSVDLLQELNITFNNIKANFFLRGIIVGLITLFSYLIFSKFGYLNYGIYLSFIIFIILFFNVQNSLNKNFSLYFILVTFWSLISSTGDFQTNLLLVLISLFIPLIPLSLYNPFAQNTYLHIFSFLIFLCIYELLKDIDINLITHFLMKFTITVSIILFGLSLLFSIENKIIKLKNYFAPLIFLGIIIFIKYFIKDLDLLILYSLDNLVITLSLITLLRAYGVVLANTYNYSINKQSESLYERSKKVFINWMGEALGEDIWKHLIGVPSKNKFSKYNQIIFIVILVLLWIINKLQFEDLKLSFSQNYFPWEIIYILLSLQLINASLTIKAWFVVHGFINEKASNQLTSKILVSIFSIFICIIIQYWSVLNIFPIWSLVTFGILYLLTLIICFINLSVDLIKYREKQNLDNFKIALAPLMMLISITITFLAFHFNINTVNLLFIFLSITCLVLGLVSGKLSKSIFAISNIVVKKLDFFGAIIIMLVIIAIYNEMTFILLFYLGYYTTTAKDKN